MLVVITLCITVLALTHVCALPMSTESSPDRQRILLTPERAALFQLQPGFRIQSQPPSFSPSFPPFAVIPNPANTPSNAYKQYVIIFPSNYNNFGFREEGEEEAGGSQGNGFWGNVYNFLGCGGGGGGGGAQSSQIFSFKSDAATGNMANFNLKSASNVNDQTKPVYFLRQTVTKPPAQLNWNGQFLNFIEQPQISGREKGITPILSENDESIYDQNDAVAHEVGTIVAKNNN